MVYFILCLGVSSVIDRDLEVVVYDTILDNHSMSATSGTRRKVGFFVGKSERDSLAGFSLTNLVAENAALVSDQS